MPERGTTRFWVGASMKGELGSVARGIRPLDVAADGSATLGEPVDVGANPMFLAVSAATGVLAVAHELTEGHVSTWTLEGDGVRAFGLPGATDAADPCHVAFDESGTWVFAANYGSGRLTAHPAGPDVAASAAFHWLHCSMKPWRDDSLSFEATKAWLSGSVSTLIGWRFT